MNNSAQWQPCASIANLHQRATLINHIRQFFNDRNILEVETPAMSHATVTDIHLRPFQTQLFTPQQTKNTDLFLMTSPEYHMKRLLAAGSGSIYQLCRCFRNEESGRHHNAEFTMLEWYHIDYTMMDLIQEVDALLQVILHCPPAQLMTYQHAFIQFFNIDPFTATKKDLLNATQDHHIREFIEKETDFDTLLQFLFVVCIEPHIGHDRPTVIYHFPASQASLAEINPQDPRVAQRFEIYYKKVELANGFCELRDANEQRQRFEEDNQKRQQLNLPEQPIDHHLLAALDHGLPFCSGVALGIDRLIMIALNANRISDIMAFTTDRA